MYHLEAGGPELLGVLLQQVEQLCVFNARHLQHLGRSVADVALVQSAKECPATPSHC